MASEQGGAGDVNPTPMFQMSNATGNAALDFNVDLDDIFSECYYLDLPGGQQPAAAPLAGTPLVPVPSIPAAAAAPVPVLAPPPVAAPAPAKRSAAEAGLPTEAKPAPVPAKAKSSVSGDGNGNNGGVEELTEQQKLERRERNREHAKRSRLRKKFLLESLQEQIHALQEQLESFKVVVKEYAPGKAEDIITRICGNKEKYTPLPTPSGFGPVKTLMEPDFRLMSALSGSQQNFAISDPTLPDNPIVYVSQGFLELTGYTLDQVLGRNCRFLQGPGTDQSAVEVIRKGIKEGVDTSVCLLNYKADGTPFWNQFFVAALRDAENNVVNFVGVQCEVSKAVVEKHMGDGKKK
ncbi:Blue-light-activated histidine kinase [Seminavis robusta]|uniref:Blue-light-activated histidine kinase n=1 Tax=Seminavis robusta TaxID=568900 RepID=A0A9N8EI45_9STRA|nr:Blue-light-activated histidine kinase [Seminavis robusta]|eukprot:Sro971_g226430.1 Blue-light-activated histidine kinase (350) ;mRNA; f:7048-8185